MKKLDILYTVDDRYLDMCLASILSLILNGYIEKIKVHIITSNLKADDNRRIDEILSRYNCEYYLYDIKGFDIEKYKIPDWRGTQVANARLFFQEIIGSNLSTIENLLYLDSDTIVVDSLNGLDNYKDNVVSAVRDACFKSYVDSLGLTKYFNSGVLLFNVDEWTKGNYQDKIINTAQNVEVPITYPDQDILNLALKEKIADLPLQYNLGGNTHLFNSLGRKLYYNRVMNFSSALVRDAKKEPKILHATGVLGIKPWQENDINPYNDIFMKYILEVNPNFKKENITKLKKILSIYPHVFKLAMLSKAYVPEELRGIARKITF